MGMKHNSVIGFTGSNPRIVSLLNFFRDWTWCKRLEKWNGMESSFKNRKLQPSLFKTSVLPRTYNQMTNIPSVPNNEKYSFHRRRNHPVENQSSDTRKGQASKWRISSPNVPILMRCRTFMRGAFSVGIQNIILPKHSKRLGGYMDEKCLECGWKKLVNIFAHQIPND